MLGNRDSGVETPKLGADNRSGNQLSAIRLPLSDFAFRFFKLFEQITGYIVGTGESGIGSGDGSRE